MLPMPHPVTILALVLHPPPMTAFGASAQQLVQRLYVAFGPLMTAVYLAAADPVAAVAADLVVAVAADLGAVDLVAATGLVALIVHETVHLAVAGQP